MPPDAPRNDVDADDGLLDFGSEASDSALDNKEPDIALNRNEPDTTLGGNEPIVILDGGEHDLPLGRKDPDSAFDTNDPAHALPLHAPAVHPFVWYTSEPVVHKSARRYVGIALLILGSIGVLAWSGRLLMGMRRDAATSGAPIQNASQPTPTVTQEAPTNVAPPTPDPPPPVTTAPAETATVPAETATPSKPATAIAPPSEARGANAPDAPRPERPARQAERPAINTQPNAAGGLFAITRPLGAQVFVDNKLIGSTPLFMSQLSPGSHEVRLELPGFSTYSSSIQVEPNKRFRLAVQLAETR